MFSLTHWGRATHICVNNLSIFASDNGLSPGRRQAIIWTNAAILLIGPMAINFSEIFIVIQIFSFKKMYLKLSSAKWRLLRLGLNVLMITERHVEKSVELPMIWDAFSLKWHRYVDAGKGLIVCVYHVRTHSQAEVWYGILLLLLNINKTTSCQHISLIMRSNWHENVSEYIAIVTLAIYFGHFHIPSRNVWILVSWCVRTENFINIDIIFWYTKLY